MAQFTRQMFAIEVDYSDPVWGTLDPARYRRMHGYPHIANFRAERRGWWRIGYFLQRTPFAMAGQDIVTWLGRGHLPDWPIAETVMRSGRHSMDMVAVWPWRDNRYPDSTVYHPYIEKSGDEVCLGVDTPFSEYWYAGITVVGVVSAEPLR